ncbi:MAG: hypothetical protein CBC38_05290 [Gammaproteobacteria bacterium TMED78]|nr:MAG: hypothetical protein CBC38_05290 [Gammaproteobacteria bacterium TMED78]|tara:strand:- start:36405 stop:37439 length:1035 start_codon:yes stop_codon:yes gene_type:complete
MKFFITMFFLSSPLIISNVNSHHSHAEYHGNEPIELIGKVIASSWSNPHVRLKLEVENLDESISIWDLEFQDLISLNRKGFDNTLVNLGDNLRVYGTPSKRRTNVLSTSNVLLPNGMEVSVRGRTQPIWSDINRGFNRVSSEDVLNNLSDSSGHGLFRVWLPQAWSENEFTDLPLTEKASLEQASYSSEIDPTMLCLAPGMPAAMRTTAVHPFSLKQEGDVIIIRGEISDIERTVNMSTNTQEEIKFSPLGYSTGSWEGDSLVIHTSNIDWPYFDHIGTVRQSKMVNTLEKFTVGEDTNYMTYSITVSDPETFTRPVTAVIPMIWRPDMTINPYECSLNDNFIH